MAETRYARNGRVHIAYEIHGTKELELVFMPGTFVPIESYDEHPMLGRFFQRLQSFARVLILDRRGMGQSDPLGPEGAPSVDESADDLAAVIDDAGFEKPHVLAGFDAALPAMVLAASRPDALASLVVVNTFAMFLRSDDHPTGFDPERAATYEEVVEFGGEIDGERDLLALAAPTVARDDRFRTWWDRVGRRSASPATALMLNAAMVAADVRDVLPRISIPTLVIHKIGDQMTSIEEGRYVAARIPGSKLVEVPGNDHLIWVDADGILDAAEEFITGARSLPVDRVLATVLFTDIVDSTRRATELGDKRWRDLLDVHDRTSARVIERGGGKLVKQTGDGMLATFPGPGPAIRCAMALRDELAKDDVRIRAGIHTGEIEVRGSDVGGIAVHIAARVMGEAGPDEIIVSSVVPPLVVGSEIAFTDRGPRELKGVPGEWRVLAVES
jgi:class 3 adenylate cyclase